LKRTGFAELPLHRGRAPQWLVKRMIRLARGIIAVIIDEYGCDVLLQRISDPYWFQALGCVLGYDWHSSGVTTVLTGVLKSAIDHEEFGLAVCGGKGKASTKAPSEIDMVAGEFGFSSEAPLYHHAFLVAEDGKWAVIQQGMNVKDRTARRYHWLSEHVGSFVVEPHEAIVGDAKRAIVLDMTSQESDKCRRISVDIAKERPSRVMNMLKSMRPVYQRSVRDWLPRGSQEGWAEPVAEFLSMPATLSWRALGKAYEFQPTDYEELLGIRGIGPATVRGLALISELVYGEKPSWKDPVKYSFAYGGKDGVPYPVDRKAMDESVYLLKEAIERAHLGDKERLRSLQRLRRFVPPDIAI